MSGQKYNSQKIEKKWQKIWYGSGAFKAKNISKKEKFYVLDEFPYPSGDGLHVGHCRPYIGMDVIARKRRMQNQNVLFPMGWDAFGLPTENYAIKTGVQPAVATKKNTDTFRRQMKSLGLSFDWSREINTTDPKYYKWTQWIFIKLFEQGLAYKDNIEINWCPKDKIGLANEEVINGKCERCGTPVQKRQKSQWLIKITKYADRLIKDLDLVDYPERVKDQQKNWIGKSEGAEIKFPIINSQLSIDVFTTRPDTLFGCTFLVLAPEHELVQKIKSKITNWPEVEKYIIEAKNKSDLARQESKEKTGIELRGIKAVNPANKKQVPLFIADYVMMGYGTGAIMAVPAHDQRDFEFAQKYHLPIRHVIMPRFIDHKNPHVPGKEVVFRKGIIGIVRNPKTGKYLGLNWKVTSWRTFIVGGIEGGETPEEAARREILEETGYKNLRLVKVLGEPVQTEFFASHKNLNRVAHTWNVLFELEDEQRNEISPEEKEKHEVTWFDASNINSNFMTHAEISLIVDRMQNPEKAFEGDGILRNSGKFDGMESQKAKEEIITFIGAKKTVQYKLRDWVFSRQHYWGEPIPMIFCQTCGWQTVPEKDLPVTLPKVKKYQPTDTGESPLATMTTWVKVKCPKCKGPARRETDTMPNWAGSNWYYLAYTAPKISNFKFQISNFAKGFEQWMPVDWYNGGMEHTTLHLLYSRFIFKFLWDIGAVPSQIGSEPYKKRTSHGVVLAEGGVKMSKSKGNVINPDQVVKQHGVDTLRVYEMFMGPFEQMIPWDQKGILGARRFLEKVYVIASAIAEPRGNLHATTRKPSVVIASRSAAIQSILNETIKKVGDDIEAMKFNTAISSLMILANHFYENGQSVSKDDFKKFLVILSPFAPHLAEELWEKLGFKGVCSQQPWPEFDQASLQKEKVFFIIQINGRVRDRIEVAAGLAQQKVEAIALRAPKIKNWTEGKQIKKIIFVPGKLINIVI